jgi:hypothetical protein
MSRHRSNTLALVSGLLLLGSASAAAQADAPRFTLEARGGFNVPTFEIADVASGGPSGGAGLGVRLTPRVWFLADADFGFHPGADLEVGGEGPDVNVYHYIAKLGYELPRSMTSRWSVILNAGAGALTFDVDGGEANTYPAINVGAKIGYQLSPRVAVVLSPQGDIAFTDEDEVGTTNAWVWPFTAGIRIGM